MKGVRPFTDEEIAAIKASFSGRYAARDRALFVVGLRTGFRISELLSLRRKEVYGHGKGLDRVSVERKRMKKKTQGRTVLLHSEARAALSGATAPSPILPASETMKLTPPLLPRLEEAYAVWKPCIRRSRRQKSCRCT